jgi:outer membrane immunogenic protein
MKKILLATIAMLGFSGAASAADLRMPVRAPIVAPVFNWTSCYFGGYVGGAWNAESDKKTDLNGYNAPASHGWAYDLDSSFIGGGTLGCNWQPVGSPWVFGLEGELGYMRITGSAPDPLSPGFDTVATTTVGDWYGMITGRLGYAWDRALVYVKGGAAFVDTSWNVVDACNTGLCGGGLIATGTAGADNVTWTIGGGIEWAFDWNWSLKAEYMYIALPDQGDACGIASTNGLTYCWHNDLDGVHTAKIGLNYRFGFGKGPVMARY